MRRELTHFWRTNLAVTIGAAVATAVLGGALIVGDSVRGSLRQLTLERLGGIDQALAGQRFLPENAADRLAALPEFRQDFVGAAPAILLQGSARHAETRTRATDVGLQGIDARFLEIFGHGADGSGQTAPFFPESEGALFAPAVINPDLARALGAEVGDGIVISLRRWSEVPSGSLLSRDDTESVVGRLRLEVRAILPEGGLATFGLGVHQGSPYNIFVPLEVLQEALDQEGTVNSIVVRRQDEGAGPNSAPAQTEPEVGREEARRLDRMLRSVLGLDELGLVASDAPAGPASAGAFTVESKEYILDPTVFGVLQSTAEDQGARTLPVLTYLANDLKWSGDEQRESAMTDTVPYSTVTALPTPPPFGSLTLVDGSPAPALGEGQILLNSWTAEQLGAQVGDLLRMEYFSVGPREELRDESEEFEVAGIVAMEGLGGDETLSQEYPGIAGSANMSEWDPPFPVSLSRIRQADEDYWDEWRDTPKAFVALDKGRELWQSRWGDITSIRIAPPASADAEFRQSYLEAVKDRLPMATFGLTFQPVKALGLGASGGATDFGGLFVGLSFFVIVSAALLVALLFGLAVERRAKEIGLRLAIGFEPVRVRNMLLAEGTVLAAIGGLLGLIGAIGYAQLMMWGLRTWWLPAVGTSRLELHIGPVALVGGYLIALAVVVLTIFLGVRRVGQSPTPQLLRGSIETSGGAARAGRASKVTAIAALGIAGLALAFGAATGRLEDPGLFYLVGPSLLVGLLALFAVWIDRPQAGALERPGLVSRIRMAVINSRRNRSRSLLSATLVAFATFLIVTVAAYQEDFSAEDLGLDSGAGGYHLVAEADVPLQQDLADPDGRFELGLPDAAEDQLAGATIMPFRLLPGDDTSCLNLYQPGQPRVLGVPASQIERGGFRFQQTIEDVDDPWTLLDRDLGGDNVIPAIGDFNSTQWILKLPLGGELPMENERGEEVRLRLVASLATSVFQSELLISEEHFLEHFPSQGGFPYFLIAADPSADAEKPLAERLDALGQTLEAGLEDYGFDAITAADKLASFHAVQNTYLSTFRSLGGLGLLLGTIGLAVVLMRNALERRSELAALSAFGFRRRTLVSLVVMENAALLLIGLAIGTLAALFTAGSHLLHQASAIPWSTLGLTLGGIFLFGLVACWLAARGALSGPLLEALKEER